MLCGARHGQHVNAVFVAGPLSLVNKKQMFAYGPYSFYSPLFRTKINAGAINALVDRV